MLCPRRGGHGSFFDEKWFVHHRQRQQPGGGAGVVGGGGGGLFPMFVKHIDKTGEIAMKRTANPTRSVCSTGETIFRRLLDTSTGTERQQRNWLPTQHAMSLPQERTFSDGC